MWVFALCICATEKQWGMGAFGCCFSEGHLCLQKWATAKAGLDPGPVISLLTFQANCTLAAISLKTILVLTYLDKSHTRGAQKLEKGHFQHSLAWRSVLELPVCGCDPAGENVKGCALGHQALLPLLCAAGIKGTGSAYETTLKMKLHSRLM